MFWLPKERMRYQNVAKCQQGSTDCHITLTLQPFPLWSMSHLFFAFGFCMSQLDAYAPCIPCTKCREYESQPLYCKCQISISMTFRSVIIIHDFACARTTVYGVADYHGLSTANLRGDHSHLPYQCFTTAPP